MKKTLNIIIFVFLLFLIGCVIDNPTIIEEELEKHNLEAILLENIKINNDGYLYAIAEDKNQEEVFVKYVINNDIMSIKEVMEYNLVFSYKDFLMLVEELPDEYSKNAYNAIINKAEKVEISEDLEIKNVLKIENDTKFNGIVFYYKTDNQLSKIVFTYDLGDYYIANETTKEIYYPIYCRYEDFP